MTDNELIEKLKSGDEEAFRYVIATYQRIVLHCSFRFLHNRESAQDITQDVFITVFESINSFKQNSKLSTWIYRITIAKSLNHISSMKRKKRFAFLTGLFGNNDEVIEIPDFKSPDTMQENSERKEILHKALDKLAQNQRVAFSLSKYDGLKYEEIAEIMAISVPAVESLIHRAKNNLQKKLYNFYMSGK